MASVKRLMKSRGNRMIFGVAGGVAEYFDVDPVLVRVGFVLLVFASGIGLILYIVMAVIMPEKPAAEAALPPAAPPSEPAAGPPASPLRLSLPGQGRGRAQAIAGLVLVGVGVLFLLSNFGLFGWFQWGQFWPLALVAIGVAILAASLRRS